MSKPQHLPLSTHWWVRTTGYHMEHSLFYLNADNRWKVDINDKSVFISHQALERLFGKGCVIRPLDLSTDIALDSEPSPRQLNAFMPHLLDNDEATVVILVNPAIKAAIINGMLIPTTSAELKVKARLRFHTA